MQKDRFLILTIIILFVLNLFTLGYVLMGLNPPPPPEMLERGPDMRRPDKKEQGRPDELIINRLKLNTDQIGKFEDLKKEHRNQVDSIQFNSRKLHDEYFGLLKNPVADTAKASALLEQIAMNQKQLDRATFSHFEKLRDICNNDQKELFNRFIDEIAGSFKPPKP
ncbi:MAG: periplasmic heavy metal sensor [Ignavibacteria bacterium]|nr:periplasmic heavy metal sensor [Ignavibacteria bacterium]MCC7159570.1 periplasmic heavy metal sensor [Ignavibacteria bacterium]